MSAASDAALAEGVAVPDAVAVLGLVGGYLATDLGRAELEGLRFHRDRGELERLQRRNAEAQLWLQRRGRFGFAALAEDPRPLLVRARHPGAGLDGVELVQILRFLDAAAGLREHAASAPGADAPAWPLIAELAAELPEAMALRQALRRALAPNGELEDAASPELARLRQRRARQRQEIEAALGQHLRKLGGEGILQDELVTVRNERFVLPVRAELRRRAPGIVHGASSSGQTVFVEPLETIELNNENIRLRDAEQAEARRILVALTALAAAEAPAIAAAAVCGVLELEAAKAAFAADYQARPASFGAELELRNARHPVLVAALRGRPGAAVVPLSLALGAQRVLVVSGPNTGGKTVVLKTVGMAAWMAQCGLPVCAERARLPIFDALWADIGDVQSLEQSLSTFSSHLVHIRDILAAATPASLILLDELGTATNAAEGAALAVAIAEFLAERRAWALISTHHDALKAWASTHADSVANGSVAVDAATLAPSYQFRFGVPGLSAGLDMARRLGMPEAIIAAARGHLGQDERQAGEYLEKLQRNLAQAEEQLAGLAQREGELARREAELAAHDRAQQQRQLAALRADLDRRWAGFAASAEANARRALATVEGEVTSAQKRKFALAAAKTKREAAAAFQAEVGSMLEEHAGASAGAAAAGLDPQPGDRVRVRSLSAPAILRRRLEGDIYEVEAGPLRLQIPRDDITAVLGAASTVARARVPEAPDVAELNLIGRRAEEARDLLEKFLDRALLASADQVRIVHGTGFGVLRQIVAETLRAHPQVARFAHPPQNQGGQGVTIAEMK